MNYKTKIVSIIMSILIILGTTAPVYADFTHFPPSGLGDEHTYTYWNTTRWIADSGRLKNYGNENDIISDTYGIVTYNGFFAAASSKTFGEVGDVLIVVETDGIIYPVIIQDIKGTGNVWGHRNGHDIFEFSILSYMRSTLYGSRGVYISELLNKPIYKVINIGSIYWDIDMDYFKFKCYEYGLGGYTLLTSPYGGEIL